MLDVTHGLKASSLQQDGFPIVIPQGQRRGFGCYIRSCHVLQTRAELLQYELRSDQEGRTYPGAELHAK